MRCNRCRCLLSCSASGIANLEQLGRLGKNDPAVNEAIDLLISGSMQGGKHFQHELTIDDMECLKKIPEPYSALNLPAISILKDNMEDQESTSNHIQMGWLNIRSEINMKDECPIIRRKLDSGVSAIVSESGNIEFLLARLLAAEAGLLPFPSLAKDRNSPVLRFRGIEPWDLMLNLQKTVQLMASFLPTGLYN